MRLCVCEGAGDDAKVKMVRLKKRSVMHYAFLIIRSVLPNTSMVHSWYVRNMIVERGRGVQPDV